MPNIDLSILNQRQTPAFYADVFANRPAAGFVGRIFVSTDTYAFYRDNGTSWDLIGGPGTGTVTGTGANGQVTFWNGASTITGSNDLFWDATNGHFGVNTNAPGTALDVHHDQSTVAILNQTTATNDVRIGFQNNGVGLWRIGAFYNAGANDFGIFDAVGNIQPVTVKKTTGQVLIGTSTVGSGKLVVASASSDNGIQIVGASAPSLRIDSSESGPTKRAGLGISTATNNFIQGSADRDFCIFNGSTAAASPILFGVYDAGAVNVQEAARISPARNFLLGTTTDAGQKLQVNGNSLLNGSLQANTGLFNTSTRYSSEIVGIQITDSNPIATVKAALRVSNNGSGYVPKIIITDNNIVDSYITLNPGGSSNTNYLGLGLGNSYNILNVFENGRIGVNTTSPNAMLDINGGDIYIRTGGVLATNTVDSYNTSLTLKSNGSTAILIPNTQNVLIGTTTDNGQKLQVNGSANINGTVLGSKFTTASGTVSNPYNVWTTMFTIPTNETAMYQLIAVSPGNGLTYTATALVAVNSAGIELRNYTPGGALILQVSGYDIQCLNGSGSTLAIYFNYMKIG